MYRFYLNVVKSYKCLQWIICCWCKLFFLTEEQELASEPRPWLHFISVWDFCDRLPIAELFCWEEDLCKFRRNAPKISLSCHSVSFKTSWEQSALKAVQLLLKGQDNNESNEGVFFPLCSFPAWHSAGILKHFGSHLCAIDYFTPRDNESLQRTLRRNTCFQEINTLFGFQAHGKILIGETAILQKVPLHSCAHVRSNVGAHARTKPKLRERRCAFVTTQWWIAETHLLTALRWKNSWIH